MILANFSDKVHDFMYMHIIYHYPAPKQGGWVLLDIEKHDQIIWHWMEGGFIQGGIREIEKVTIKDYPKYFGQC